MPLKSKSQQRFMFSQHPEMAKEWADKTPDIKKLPEHVQHKAEGGSIQEEPGLQDTTVSDSATFAALAGLIGAAPEALASAPEMLGSEAGEITLGNAPEMEGPLSKIQAFSKGIMGKGTPNEMTIWGVKGDPEEIAKLGYGKDPASIPEHILRQHGILPSDVIDASSQNAPNSFAQGGEVIDSADKEFHSEMRKEGPMLGISHQGYSDGGEVDKVHDMKDIGLLAGLKALLRGDKTEASQADNIDPVQTSSGTAHGSTDSAGQMGYADGGDVDPVDLMTQAAAPSALPVDTENGAAPLPNPNIDQDFINKLNAGMNLQPAPTTPNPISQAAQAAQKLPATTPNIYQGITADQRAALMQSLLAQKGSRANLAVKGVAGLGDAITSAFGKSPTNAMGTIQANENQNIANRVGAIDTQRQQRLQDLQANLAIQENDPTSAYSQGMRQFYSQLTGKQFPSGISASMMKSAFPDYAKIFDSQLTAATAQRGQTVQAQEKAAEISPWHRLVNNIFGNPAEEALTKTATGGQNQPSGNTQTTPSGISYTIHQ
jgi:hypothetical protein